MKIKIRDVFNQEHQLSSEPPEPGEEGAPFRDQRAAEQFLGRFAGDPVAMSRLRSMVNAPGEPVHRTDPRSMLVQLAGRMITKGLRLITGQAEAEAGGGAAGKGSTSSSTGGAEEKEAATAVPEDAQKKKPEVKKKSLKAS